MRSTGWSATLVAALALVSVSPCAAFQLRAPAGGTVHALVIGINDYPKLAGHSLRGARPDAEDIAAALTKDGVKDLTLVRDQEATRARIVGEMDRLVATTKAGDLVIISYAGHGMQVPEYERWHGIDKNGVNEQIALSGFDFTGQGVGEVIVNEEVRAWLSRLDAKGVDTLVAWDSCFGGGMRGIAPGGGEIRVRVVPGSPEEVERKKFVGIQMTDKEARADVKAMPHITFLAGATSKSVVPEMAGVDPKDPTAPRGALSYFLARSLEGALKSGEIARSDLFPYLKQSVRQATQERQAIQVDPQSEDVAIAGRNVFVVGEAIATTTTTTTTITTTTPAPTIIASSPTATPPPTFTLASVASEKVEPVRLAIINGPADAFRSIEPAATPLVIVADPSGAELTWNVGDKLALSHGDMLMENVDGSMIGAIADRVRTLTRLRAIGESRPLQVRTANQGALLTSGQTTSVDIDGAEGENLVVFNIAADATVQMIYPPPPGYQVSCHHLGEGARWSCGVVVDTPFGVDAMVALATSDAQSSLVDWLRAHHGRRDAAQLPEKLESVLAADASARMGFVPVVTRATAY